MDGMVTTPLTSEEAEKTLAQLEENKQTRLNRMKRDLKVNILYLVLSMSIHVYPCLLSG